MRDFIIGIDFDGTIVDHRFPHIGQEVPCAIDMIKQLQENGCKVFLWTMRGNFENSFKGQDLLGEAIEFLESRGLHMDGYNKSPEQFSDSPKQFADIYIDDTALGIPCYISKFYPDRKCSVNWVEVGKLLVKWGLLTEKQYLNIIIRNSEEILKYSNDYE